MRRSFGMLFQRSTTLTASPALRRAHEMMNMGDYAQAAMTFEQLAHTAEMRDGPRAPYLHLQAGRARMLNSQPAVALPHFKRGLELLIADGRYTQVYKVGQRIVQELKLRGLEREAREIAALVGGNTPATADLPTERGPDMATVVLPTHCEACGGPIRPSEVEWLDMHTAECSYCGSPIRAL
ncbi:MAG: hypothetical protein DDG60_10660 [Anaerolineae bacterium]|nr:MAG: hypothetical protein DDG60_10660 [Anaerolineae bacterium]